MKPSAEPGNPVPRTAPRAVERLVDLANALRDDPSAGAAVLGAVLEAHGEPPGGPGEVGAEQLRAAVRRLVPVLGTDRLDEAAEAVNVLLAEHAAAPRLTRHDGSPWHIHVTRSDQADWGEWLLASSALGLAQAIAERGRCAWGRCAADGCGRYFADTGPGSRRRFCSARCANRTRVAEHRRRARTVAAAEPGARAPQIGGAGIRAPEAPGTGGAPTRRSPTGR